MIHQETPTHPTGRDGRERGSALLMALMVALVLVFLGMGLLLQTSLGLEASGTDRWVVKALYAADAGVMMQIQMVQLGQVGPPAGFNLVDDPTLPGLLQGQFGVAINNFCETRPPTYIEGYEVNLEDSSQNHVRRYFHFRSDAQRTLGGLGGLTRASVAVDVTAAPFVETNIELGQPERCYE